MDFVLQYDVLIELIFVVVFFLMIKEYHYMKVKHECYFQILLFL